MESPFEHLMRELARQFPDSWVNSQGWKLSGLPHSRLWLRIDQGYNQPWPTEDKPATWDTVRIDIKESQGRHANPHVTTLSQLENASDAAAKVREACQKWEDEGGM